MAKPTKVSSYKRTTKGGKVVDVQQYTQKRDLASPALNMPGRPGVSGKPGAFGRGRQFPGVHDEPPKPPPSSPAPASSAADSAQQVADAIGSMQQGLEQLRQSVAAVLGSQPQEVGRGQAAGEVQADMRRGEAERKAQFDQPGAAPNAPAAPEAVPLRQGGEKSSSEGRDAVVPKVAPMTDSEYEEHQKEIQYKIDEAVAAGQETYKLHTVDEDNEVYTKERAQLHDEILSSIIERHAHVPREKKAVMAGGLGGAGKSTVLTKFAGIPKEDYLTINPDDLKEELVKRGLGPQIEGLSPMEASMLLHEESSTLSKMLATRAYAEGMNVTWDITMASKKSAAEKLDEMDAAGYEVEAVFVEIPVDESVSRALKRHRRGADIYRNGEGLGGRYVPPYIIQKSKDDEFGSNNRRVMEELKDRFVGFRIYDNSVFGRDPMLKAEGGRRREQQRREREARQKELTQTTQQAMEKVAMSAPTALSQAIAHLRGIVN